MIGRVAELGAICTLFAPSANADTHRARGGVLFVVGEHGIGKTRLVTEAAARARDCGVKVLRGRAPRSGSAGLRPFVEALLGLARAGFTPSDRLGPYLAVLGQLVPDWRGAGPDGGPTPSCVYGEAILRVLDEAGDNGVLLVLEDLHDADTDTLAVLEYLVDNIGGRQAAVVCTLRDGPSPALDLADYARRADQRALLTLSRLGTQHIAELCAAELGTTAATLSAELRTAVVRAGAGNPLLAAEILREQADRGNLVCRAGLWDLVASVPMGAPRTLARVVADHLRECAPTTRDLLQSASVLGEEFPPDLLGAAARIAAPDLRSALDHAARHRYLVAGSRPDRVAWRHPLIAQAVRDQLTPPVHRDLALAAAEAIGAMGPHAGPDWTLRAAELREDGGDILGAADLFAEAGVRALREGAPAVAVELLTRARRCQGSKTSDSRWAQLLGHLVAALGMQGRHHEALAFAAEVQAVTGPGPGPVPDVVRAGLGADTRPGSPDTPAAGHRIAATPPSCLSPGPAPAAIADLEVAFARVATRASRPDRVLVHVRAARDAVGRSRDVRRDAELDIIQAGALLEFPGRAAEAERLAVRALTAAEHAGLPTVQAEALLLLGRCRQSVQPAESAECYRRAHLLAQTHDLPGPRLEARLVIGAYEWMWHADPTGLVAAGAEAEAQGAVIEALQVRLSLAVDALFRGRFAETEDVLDATWPELARLRLVGLGSYALAVRALLSAHRGQEAALALDVAGFDRWRGDRDDESPLVHGLAQGMNALIHGDVGTACRHFRTLPPPDADDRPKYQLSGQYGLGLLARTVHGSAGWREYTAARIRPPARLPWNAQYLWLVNALLSGRDNDRAGAEYALAEALCASEAFTPARHLSLLLVATAAARDGWGEPARWLQEAEAYYTSQEVPSAVRVCRDALRELGQPLRQRRRGCHEVPQRLWSQGVTVREYEVLLGVAMGRTNKEVAAQLHLSHRTVERHVANLMAKTGAGNRRELGALMTGA